MRHLVARFVKQPENSTAIHVVDPYLDLRSRFKDLEKLKENISARKLNINVDEVAKSYNMWWEKFTEFYKCSKDDKENVRDNEILKNIMSWLKNMQFLFSLKCKIEFLTVLNICQKLIFLKPKIDF